MGPWANQQWSLRTAPLKWSVTSRRKLRSTTIDFVFWWLQMKKTLILNSILCWRISSWRLLRSAWRQCAPEPSPIDRMWGTSSPTTRRMEQHSSLCRMPFYRLDDQRLTKKSQRWRSFSIVSQTIACSNWSGSSFIGQIYVLLNLL